MRVKKGWYLNFQLPILPTKPQGGKNMAIIYVFIIHNQLIWLEGSSTAPSGGLIPRNENKNR